MLVSKSFWFDAAHQIPSLPRGHKCRRPHGHSYQLDVELQGPLVNGMVMEYGLLAAAVQPLLLRLDHRPLNKIRGLENPTTEVLATWIFKRLRRRLPLLTAVTVHESRSTQCTYRP